MVAWHFYQGFKNEWRWYRLADAGTVVRESDQGFAELRACMTNAERSGFAGHAFRVHARAPVPEAGRRSRDRRLQPGDPPRALEKQPHIPRE